MKRAFRLTIALIACLLLAPPAWCQLVNQVRRAADARDFARGEQLVESYRNANGVTPEMILALSWLGRGAQSAAAWDKADKYATETRQLALAELEKRPLDADEALPLALGASIEVQAHAMAARNARSDALLFLDQELKRWRDTSIRARIQKNAHMLSLAGQPAPPLETKEYLGTQPVPLSQLKGKPVILFFWAHWCGSCKRQVPVLERLQKEYGPQGLLLVGPTQRYGYVAGGVDASPEQELEYIAEVRKQFYSQLDMTVPVSEENFQVWGSSTSPTLAVVDRAGLVKLYHPGNLTYGELAPVIAAVVAGK